jgi:hypothetical protein
MIKQFKSGKLLHDDMPASHAFAKHLEGGLMMICFFLVLAEKNKTKKFLFLPSVEKKVFKFELGNEHWCLD